jgi:enoyl-CoA hydratase/carnithine racemase
MTMSDIIIKDEGAVRVVRMNRPDKKNALNAPMYDALTKAIGDANSDTGIRCVLIAGAPGAFCAGNDLQDFLRAATGEGGLGDSVVHFLYALARAQKPLVAAVQGVAVGIGTTMLLHCDYVVAGSDARFSTPFVHLGLVPEAASSLLAPRLMGHRRAFSLLVMGRPMTAMQAKECGLVNDIVEPAEVEAAALKAAREIAALPPQAVMASRNLLRGSPAEIVERIDDEARVYLDRLRTPEARAALDAFFKRKK